MIIILLFFTYTSTITKRDMKVNECTQYFCFCYRKLAPRKADNGLEMREEQFGKF